MKKKMNLVQLFFLDASLLYIFSILFYGRKPLKFTPKTVKIHHCRHLLWVNLSFNCTVIQFIIISFRNYFPVRKARNYDIKYVIILADILLYGLYNRYMKDGKSGMTIMEVGVFSGFTPDKDSLIEVNKLDVNNLEVNKLVSLPRCLLTSLITYRI